MNYDLYAIALKVRSIMVCTNKIGLKIKGVLTRLRKRDSSVIRTGNNFTYTYSIYQDNINIQSSSSKGES